MRIQRTPAPPKAPRALLCVHGAGCSPAIFRVQLSKLRAALREDFEFVYATAPFPSAPGPGILPTFEGLGPYYTWFEGSPSGAAAKGDNSNSNDSNSSPTVHDHLAAVHEPVRRAIAEWQTQNPSIPIVGTVSFSEGALVTALLLWQQQMGRIPWLPVMQVAMFICCWYQHEATQYMREEVGCGGDGGIDGEKLVIRGVLSLHLQGRDDFALAGSKMVVAQHFVPGEAQVLEFAGRHHFPNRPRDVLETVKRFRQLCVRARVIG